MLPGGAWWCLVVLGRRQLGRSASLVGETERRRSGHHRNAPVDTTSSASTLAPSELDVDADKATSLDLVVTFRTAISSRGRKPDA